MKKIVCIACMSVISVFGYVSSYDFSDRSQSPDSPYAAQILEQSYGNQSITSKKRNTFHKSKTSKKIKQTKQDFDNKKLKFNNKTVITKHSSDKKDGELEYSAMLCKWLQEVDGIYPGLD